MKRAQLGKSNGLSGATKMALPPSHPPFKKAQMYAYSRTEYEPDIERVKLNTHIGCLPYK